MEAEEISFYRAISILVLTGMSSLITSLRLVEFKQALLSEPED